MNSNNACFYCGEKLATVDLLAEHVHNHAKKMYAVTFPGFTLVHAAENNQRTLCGDRGRPEKTRKKKVTCKRCISSTPKNQIDVTPELMAQWEPKVHKMLQGVFLYGISYEDACQELRLTIVNSARLFDSAKKVSFHTYVHSAMRNTINQLIGRGQNYDTIELEKVEIPVEDPEPGRMEEVFKELKLNTGQRLVCDMLLCGYNIKEVIAMSVKPTRTLRIFDSLQRKHRALVKLAAKTY